MITLIIIICVVLVIFSLKKDKHDITKDTMALSQLPSFVVHAKPMSSFSKFINLATNKSELLKRFYYSQGTVEIELENGYIFKGLLSEMFVEFVKQTGLVIYYIKCRDKKLNFYQTTNISDQQWEAITSVLCLAGSTRGRDQFSKAAKYSGYLAMAMKAIKAIS